MTYWDMNNIEVDNIMTELVKKSLAASDFDQGLDSDVYSIHILLLDYLKTQLREDEEKMLHKHFLDQYFRKVNFQYGKLEDDSYIFSNLGYHLIKSGQFDLFPTIYLDLSFVEAVLKSSSCTSVDLLNDYKRYEEYLVGPNEEFINKLQDYEEFTRTIGAFVNLQGSSSDTNDNSALTNDVVQLALKEPRESSVHKAAILLARERPERLYMDWINKDMTRSFHKATILHHGSVQAACFLPDMTKLLTTNGDGQIKIWNVTSGEVCHRFTGHRSCVKAMTLSPDGEWFVSGSEDGEIKIWDLGTFRDESDNGHEKQQEILRTGSVKRSRSQDVVDGGNSPPRETIRRKEHHQTVNQIITTDHHDLKDLSNKSFCFNELHDEMILSVGFSPDGTEVVVSGQSGAVKIFNLEARGLRLTLSTHKEPVNVCKFSSAGDSICTGSDDATVRIWRSSNGEFLGSFNLHGLRVLDVEFVPHAHKVVSLSADKLICWNNPIIPSTCQMNKSAEKINSTNKSSNISTTGDLGILEFKRTRLADFICMTLCREGHEIEEDLTLLAAGTVDNIITIWDFESAQILLSLPGHSSFIQALDFNDDDSFLLSGSADETVMIWSLESLYDPTPDSSPAENQCSLSLGPVFDVKFLFPLEPCNGNRSTCRNEGSESFEKKSCVVRMITPDDSNCLRVLDDGITLFKSPSEEGNMIRYTFKKNAIH